MAPGLQHHRRANTNHSLGDSFAVNFSGNGGTLQATAQFTVTNWDTGEWDTGWLDKATFNIGITNNSLLASSRLTSLSIGDFDPELASAQVNGSTWVATTNTNSGGSSVDVCVWEGSNCNGGSNQGVAGAGGFESFNLNVSFYSLLNELDLDVFIAKFQTDSGSFHLTGCIVGTRNCSSTSVPEPSTLALMGLGLLGCAALQRRRRRSH